MLELRTIERVQVQRVRQEQQGPQERRERRQLESLALGRQRL
jgi:hypothetical protein